MQKIGTAIYERAFELMNSGEVARVLGWEKGELAADWSVALFEDAEELKGLVYGDYAGANLSKTCVLRDLSKLEGKSLVILKPCDTLSFNQLIKEHRVVREKFYIIGAGCKGMKDENGLLAKCKTCKSKNFEVYDEIIDDEEARTVESADRFEEVAKLEAMTHEERFEFWRNELSRCIRCNACRNICPACTCRKCVFDNPDSGVAEKANVTDFQEDLFHIIRAFHVAGRCTDCGECSRVCPQNIPLHLFNRKYIKDINELYGEYQAGEGEEERTPLTSYQQSDVEPSVVHTRGNA